jgi:hypothetical protein
MADQTPEGYVWIVFPRIPSGRALLHNRDFDPAKHTLFVEAPTKTEAEEQSAWIAEQVAKPAAEVIDKIKSAPAPESDEAIAAMAEILRAMRAAEVAGKNRTTVLAALDEQIAKYAPKP